MILLQGASQPGSAWPGQAVPPDDPITTMIISEDTSFTNKITNRRTLGSSLLSEAWDRSQPASQPPLGEFPPVTGNRKKKETICRRSAFTSLCGSTLDPRCIYGLGRRPAGAHRQSNKSLHAEGLGRARRGEVRSTYLVRWSVRHNAPEMMVWRCQYRWLARSEGACRSKS